MLSLPLAHILRRLLQDNIAHFCNTYTVLGILQSKEYRVLFQARLQVELS